MEGSPLSYIIVAVVAALPGLYSVWRGRNKTDADAASVLVTAATNMTARWEGRVKALECELESLKKRVRVLECDNDTLLRGASRLEGQVVSLGHEPVWRVSELRPQDAAGD